MICDKFSKLLSVKKLFYEITTKKNRFIRFNKFVVTFEEN